MADNLRIAPPILAANSGSNSRCLWVQRPMFAGQHSYDTETGDSVTIEKGNLVRTGREIEIYDEADGEYRTMTVEGIYDTGAGVEIETYDYEAGEYRTFEMED